jgi:hypothetical protein
MPREEMLSRMSARELAEWRTYDELEPIGAPRADLRSAILAQILANAHRDPKKEALTLEQFVLKTPDALVREKTEEEKELELVARIKRSLGGDPREKDAEEA